MRINTSLINCLIERTSIDAASFESISFQFIIPKNKDEMGICIARVENLGVSILRKAMDGWAAYYVLKDNMSDPLCRFAATLDFTHITDIDTDDLLSVESCKSIIERFKAGDINVVGAEDAGTEDINTEAPVVVGNISDEKAPSEDISAEAQYINLDGPEETIEVITEPIPEPIVEDNSTEDIYIDFNNPEEVADELANIILDTTPEPELIQDTSAEAEFINLDEPEEVIIEPINIIQEAAVIPEPTLIQDTEPARIDEEDTNTEVEDTNDEDVADTECDNAAAEYEDAQRQSAESNWIVVDGYLYHKSKPITQRNRICSEIHCIKSTDDFSKANCRVFYNVARRGNFKGEYRVVEIERGNKSSATKELLLPFKEAGLAIFKPGLFGLYLEQSFDSSKLITLVRDKSWINNECTLFNVGDELIGHNADKYDAVVTSGDGFRCRGTLEEWKQLIGKYVEANSNLMFALGVSLFSPLYKLLDLDYTSCVYHFYGNSSRGKTTTALVANSVWGSPSLIQDWNMTKNGAESTLTSRSGIGVCFDELRTEGEKAQLDCLIYIISRDGGAKRMTQDMQDKEIKQWRVACLSTGEESLFSYLNNQGKKVIEGHMSRFIDIPFEVLNSPIESGFEDSIDITTHKLLSKYLRKQCRKLYGSVGRAFIKYCIDNKQEVANLAERCEKMIEAYEDRDLSPISATLSRVRDRLLIVMLPLLILRKAGVLDCSEEQIIEKVETVVRRYEEISGGDAVNLKQQMLLRNLYTAIQEYEDGALKPAIINTTKDGPWTKLSTNKHGYRWERIYTHDSGKETKSVYYSFPSGWMNDKLNAICESQDIRSAASRNQMLKPILIYTNRNVSGEKCYGINYSVLDSIVCGT